jgi:UDP-2-acetamido-2,6-beta-L-arabino-hexul-4-ose reductase
MRIVVTGANGFIGRNLVARLGERGHADIGLITRDTSEPQARSVLEAADVVFHLAGVNRPQDPVEFTTGNATLTATLCKVLETSGRHATLVLASSTQATQDHPYGRSKQAAEQAVREHGRRTGAPTFIFRFTNVFGKWARPHHNSAVATFCHHIARGLPITVHDRDAPLNLVYVDDVMEALLQCLPHHRPGSPALDAQGWAQVEPVYATTVGEVADCLLGFAASRATLLTPRVGTGLVRALYSTYLSHLPAQAFAYEVPRHSDPRGTFVEMLKTPDCGQFSYFTAHPGVTRGEHYHHSKSEKFLVIKGKAHFGFRHIATGERHELVTLGGEGKIVETSPGWTHNITNVGDEEMIVMLWANEIFDRDKPDTFACKVG